MSDDAREHLTDRGFKADPIYLTGLDRCQPASALAPQPKPRHWRTLPYRTEAHSGVMVMAGVETAAPEITYPLEASGWHAISIGVWGVHITPGTTRYYGDLRTYSEVLAKLSGDDTFSILTLPGLEWTFEERLHELFWKVADLTDQELVLSQESWRIAEGDGIGSLQCPNANIAYIKLVPLADDEVDAWQADRRQTDTRRVFVHNDAGGPLYYRPTTAEEIRRHLENYRDSDIERVYWEGGSGDSLNYFSKIGRVSTYAGLEDFGRMHPRMDAEALRILQDKGVDPFQVALEHAHEMGLGFHACYRVAGFHFPPPHDYFNNGPTYFKSHPELRGVDREGNTTPGSRTPTRRPAGTWSRCCGRWPGSGPTASVCSTTGGRRSSSTSRHWWRVQERVWRGPAADRRGRPPVALLSCQDADPVHA